MRRHNPQSGGQSKIFPMDQGIGRSPIPVGSAASAESSKTPEIRRALKSEQLGSVDAPGGRQAASMRTNPRRPLQAVRGRLQDQRGPTQDGGGIRDASDPSVAPTVTAKKRYIDRFGRLHRERILTLWPEHVRVAMGIRPIDSDSRKEAPSSTVS